MVFKLDKNKEEIRSEWLGKANLLTETLPYMKRYSNKVIVMRKHLKKIFILGPA